MKKNPIHSLLKECLTTFSLCRLQTILIRCAQTYKEIQYTRINNDIIKRNMLWHADRVLQISMTTIIEDFTWNAYEFIRFDSDYYRYTWYYDNFNDIITYDLVLDRIYKYNTRTCKITILPLEATFSDGPENPPWPFFIPKLPTHYRDSIETT